jgi:hypothetical protein
MSSCRCFSAASGLAIVRPGGREGLYAVPACAALGDRTAAEKELAVVELGERPAAIVGLAFLENFHRRVTGRLAERVEQG